MTLVVARVTQDQIFVLADTRIYDPRRPKDVTGGMLKTMFLSPNTSLSFTGDPDLAQRAVQEFRAANGMSAPFRKTIDHFKASTAGNSNEYLLGFAGPRRLFHLANGVEKEKRTAWLGDANGFARFQEGARPAAEEYWRMMSVGPELLNQNLVLEQVGRFQEVLEDPDIANVGDFFTLALSPHGLFRQATVATLYFDAASKSKLLAPNGTPLLGATGENRKYRFSAWSPKQSLTSAAAFVFPEVQKCLLFHSPAGGFSDRCEVIDGLGRDELEQVIQARFGIPFHYLETWHVPGPSPLDQKSNASP